PGALRTTNAGAPARGSRSEGGPRAGLGDGATSAFELPGSAIGQDVPYHVGNVPLGLSLMYGAGLISALLGIGSGVLKIPAMDTALRLPIKVSSATSNLMIGVTGAASAGAYFTHGDIDIGVSGPVALGSVVGAFAGARMLIGLSSEKLRVFLVIVLAL